MRPDDAAATYEALTTRARSLLATSFEDARLVSDGRLIVLWREGDFGREADAELAAELVSEVARFGDSVMATLRNLPGTLYVPPTGNWDTRHPPAVYTRHPATVRIGPIDRDGRAVMSASAPCGRAAPAFRIEIGAGGTIDGPVGQFPSDVGDAVEQVGPSVIECDRSQVVLTWPGLEKNRQRLLAGAALIGAFARTQSTGLYR